METKIIKCHICGKSYRFYSMSAADQSACPECVRETEMAVNRPSTEKERERRIKAFSD